MRKAILHLGLHKTGTTFLQLTMRRWFAENPGACEDIFYSSQHAKSSQWLGFRSKTYLHMRDRIAFRHNSRRQIDEASLTEMLDKLSLLDKFRDFQGHFAKPQNIFLHSDENTLGATFGHLAAGGRLKWPFYPNGDWLAATVALAASTYYESVEIILSVRTFDEMILSSLKDAVLQEHRIDSLQEFRDLLSNIGAQFEHIVDSLRQFGAIEKIHILDFDILKRSQNEYFAAFLSLLGEFKVGAGASRAINASPDEDRIVALLIDKKLVGPDRGTSSLRDIVGCDFLSRAKLEYGRTIDHLRTLGPKVLYYS